MREAIVDDKPRGESATCRQKNYSVLDLDKSPVVADGDAEGL